MRGIDRAGRVLRGTPSALSGALRRGVAAATACLLTAGLAVAVPTVAPATAAAAAADCTISAKLVPSCGVLTGVSTYKASGQTWEQSVTAYESKVGTVGDVLHNYHDWTDTFPNAAEKARAANGQKLLITWIGGQSGGSKLRWADIASGQHDAVIDAQAKAVKAFGQPIWVNFQNEPEGLIGKSGTAAEFVAAWRHIHGRFKAAGVTNAVWTIVYMGIPESQSYVDKTIATYPGDEYVDWIGWDPYNRASCGGYVWKDFRATVKPFYDWLMKNGHSDKPFMLAEYASIEDPNNPNARADWFTGAGEALTNNEFPNLKVVSYFDHPAPPATCDWRIETSPKALASFQAFTAKMKTFSTTSVSVPSAPRSLAVTPTSGSAVVTWQAPATNGAGSITSYTVTASPGGAKVVVPGPAPITEAAMTGLTPGVQYTFSVTATNSAGVGAVATAVATPKSSKVTVTNPTSGGWKLNGKAVVADGGLRLTDAVTKEVKSTAWWPTAVAPSSIAVTFTSTMDGGLGADGTALVFGDAAAGVTPTSLGNSGGGLGWSGIKGVAVALDTFKNGTDPSDNFLGVATGWESSNPKNLVWKSTKAVATTLRGTQKVAVVVSGGKLYLALNGVQQIVTPVTMPSSTLIGFSAGQGGRTDRHLVTNVSVSSH